MELVPIRRHPTAFRQRRRRIGGENLHPHLVSLQGERNVTTPLAYFFLLLLKKMAKCLVGGEYILLHKDPPSPTPNILDMEIVAQDIR